MLYSIYFHKVVSSEGLTGYLVVLYSTIKKATSVNYEIFFPRPRMWSSCDSCELWDILSETKDVVIMWLLWTMRYLFWDQGCGHHVTPVNYDISFLRAWMCSSCDSCERWDILSEIKDVVIMWLMNYEISFLRSRTWSSSHSWIMRYPFRD